MHQHEWPLWKVLIRSKQGLEHKHYGSLHAVDAKQALRMAHNIYTHRQEGVPIWVMPSAAITASKPDDKPMLFDPMADKIYRHPTFYRLPDEVNHIRAAAMTSDAHLQYIPRLADNALILGQRNAEWTGRGPVLERDIALSNLSLDLIGQARLPYTHAGRVEDALTGTPHTEDDYAYRRAEPAFRNYTPLELPHTRPLVATSAAACDYVVIIVRHFLYAALMVPLWEALTRSTDPELVAIAARSVKEMCYHLAHTRDWLVHFGDDTDEPHARSQAALDWLMPYTNEFFATDDIEMAAAEVGFGVRPADLRDAWEATVYDALDEATLRWPEPGPHVSTGKHGVHSEHMGCLLAEMQGLARQYPGVSW